MKQVDIYLMIMFNQILGIRKNAFLKSIPLSPVKNTLTFILFFVTVLHLSNCSAQTSLNFDSIKNNCFKVLLYKKSELIKIGSGFVLIGNNENDKSTICITNEHVLEGGDSAIIEFDNEKIFIDSVQFTSFKKDFVAFEINNDYKRIGLLSKIHKTKINTAQSFVAPAIGETVFTISSPEGLFNSVSNGIISSIRNKEGVNFIQFTASVSPGSSGGALLNEKGKLIGLISSQYKEGQNLNFALGIDEILSDFLQPENKNKTYACSISKLEKEKIAANPYLNTVDSLVKINMTLAYQKMKENPQLISEDERLLFIKLSYENKNMLYLDFISTCSIYYEKNGLNSLLALNLINFRNQLDNQNLSDSYFLEIMAQINKRFIMSSDIAPFLDLILGTCKYRIKDYYAAITYMNEYENFKKEDLKFDDVDHKTNYTLLGFYFYYGYEIIGFSYLKLDNYNLAIENLIKCLDLSVSDEGCNASIYLISAFVKQNDFENACRYFNKYKNNCSSVYDDDFKKMFNDSCK